MLRVSWTSTSLGAADFTKLINAPTSTATQIDQAVTNAEHTNRAMLDKIGEDTSDGTRLTYASEGYAKKAELDEVALGALKVVEAGAPARGCCHWPAGSREDRSLIYHYRRIGNEPYHSYETVQP